MSMHVSEQTSTHMFPGELTLIRYHFSAQKTGKCAKIFFREFEHIVEPKKWYLIRVRSDGNVYTHVCTLADVSFVLIVSQMYFHWAGGESV